MAFSQVLRPAEELVDLDTCGKRVAATKRLYICMMLRYCSCLEIHQTVPKEVEDRKAAALEPI